MESSDDWSSQGGEDELPPHVGEAESIGIKCGASHDKSSEDEELEEEEDEGDEDYEAGSWDDELQSFLEESPEFRAKVQYQVRVVALIPGFEAIGSKASAFSRFYKLRFGKSLLESTGFTSAEILCRSMPHVIQRQALDKQGEVLLVESPKNNRIVAGIRSGLRRIVFQVLKQHPKGVSPRALDSECSKLIGRPLSVVLAELAYDTPTVECMVRDMADIASLRGLSGASLVFLSSEAEDPALTDGILSGFGGEIPSDAAEAPVSGSDVMQAKLRATVLLALHSGGIEVSRLQKAYAETFTENLDCRVLGFASISELVRDWSDIVLVQDSSVPHKLFLRPTPRVSRLLRTLSSGLRLDVFSILLKCYPDGLEPHSVLSQLDESQQEQVLEIYTGNSVNDESREALLLHGFCLMIQEMMDFIVFDSLDDGTLILKLRDAGFPLVDFPESGTGDEFVKLLVEGGGGNAIVENSGGSCKIVEQEVSSPGTSSGNKAALEHRIRLIMGSFPGGLLLEEFLSLYSGRASESLTGKGLREFVSKTPGLLRMVRGRVFLVESPKNLRIVEATKAGLRQLLYWALLQNPGGLWSELFEGWFRGFTGFSLAKVLLRYGYSGSSPVDEFLHDMPDVCSSREGAEGTRFFLLNEDMIEDPTGNDGLLMKLEIEYDPVKLCLEIEGETSYQSDGEEGDDEQRGDEVSEYQRPKAYATQID